MVPCPNGKKNDAASDGDGDADEPDGSGIFGEEEPSKEERDDGAKGVERAEDGEVGAAKGGDHGEIADGVEPATDEDIAPEGGVDESGVEEREGGRGKEHDRVGENPGVMDASAIEEETFLNGIGGNAEDDSK